MNGGISWDISGSFYMSCNNNVITDFKQVIQNSSDGGYHTTEYLTVYYR